VNGCLIPHRADKVKATANHGAEGGREGGREGGSSSLSEERKERRREGEREGLVRTRPSLHSRRRCPLPCPPCAPRCVCRMKKVK